MDKQITNQILIKKMYIKDLSFENPLGSQNLSFNTEPKVNLNVKVDLTNLNKNIHETTLILKADANLNKQSLFIIELQYTGIFEYKIENEKTKKNFVIEAGKILFPYARTIISNVTKDGGFNPLIIQPFDMANIYED